MIFRHNIHQTYSNQFQIGTQKSNIQKQYKGRPGWSIVIRNRKIVWKHGPYLVEF